MRNNIGHEPQKCQQWPSMSTYFYMGFWTLGTFPPTINAERMKIMAFVCLFSLPGLVLKNDLKQIFENQMQIFDLIWNFYWFDLIWFASISRVPDLIWFGPFWKWFDLSQKFLICPHLWDPQSKKTIPITRSSRSKDRLIISILL